jgi:protoporphyrinogen/coproporphyrinogen III oxidase
MSSANEIETDIVVIGAGLTGLTAAHYLNKEHKNFLVLEKSDKTGGVIQSQTVDGYLYEEGPNTGVVGNTTVVELFEQLSDKCTIELGGNNVKKRYILKNGQWEALPLGLWSAVTTPLFTFKDKLRLLGEPFRKAGNDPHENLASFVKRRMGKSFLDYAIDPFIIGVYAGDPNYLIPKYALPKLYNIEQEYGSLIGGSFKKGFIKKSEEEKKVSKKVFSCKGGLGELTNALTASVGIENIRLGAKDIVVMPSKNAYIITYTDAKGELITINCKKVITTIGAYALEKTLPFVEKSQMQKINSLHYTKVIELALGFDKWEGRKLDAFGGLIPSSEKRNILGILNMSSLFENRAPEGGALVSIFMGGVRRQDLIALTDNEIKRVVEKECQDLLALPEFNPDLFKIIRHNFAIPQYGVESGERFETIAKLEAQYKGLLIGGNQRNGIGMADRIKQGKELALEAL